MKVQAIKQYMSIKAGLIVGACVGAGVAVILLSLMYFRPFSPEANAAVENLTFRLCPLAVLGFGKVLGGMAGLVVITILGNAILYAAAFGLVAALLALFRQMASLRTK